jgi:methionyl-tRNA formyltransferase
MKKQAVVLGKGTLAIRIADWFRRSDEYELQRVVPVVPEPAWSDSMIGWCQSHDVPYVETGHYKDIPGVHDESWSVDLAFSCFCDKIIRKWFIDKAERILNLHNGPLPRYRGVSPINWALKNGERIHGATLHEITPGIDDGPIVGQITYSIYPESDEVIDVYQRSLEYGYLLFEQTIPILERITPQPQNEDEASYYSREDNERLGERRNFTRAQSLG